MAKKKEKQVKTEEVKDAEKVETIEEIVKVEVAEETKKVEKAEEIKPVSKFTASEWARQKRLPTVVFSTFVGVITEKEFIELAKIHLNQNKYKIE